MKGMVFTNFMEMVESQWSLDMADSIIADAQVSGAYTSIGNYPHEIDESLAELDWPRLLRAGHTLKGVFATFSAQRGEHIARQLETTAREADIHACKTLATQLHLEVEIFLQAIATSAAT